MKRFMKGMVLLALYVQMSKTQEQDLTQLVTVHATLSAACHDACELKLDVVDVPYGRTAPAMTQAQPRSLARATLRPDNVVALPGWAAEQGTLQIACHPGCHANYDAIPLRLVGHDDFGIFWGDVSITVASNTLPDQGMADKEVHEEWPQTQQPPCKLAWQPWWLVLWSSIAASLLAAALRSET